MYNNFDILEDINYNRYLYLNKLVYPICNDVNVSCITEYDLKGIMVIGNLVDQYNIPVSVADISIDDSTIEQDKVRLSKMAEQLGLSEQ